MPKNWRTLKHQLVAVFTSNSTGFKFSRTAALEAASIRESFFAKLRIPAKTRCLLASFTARARPRPELAPVTTATGAMVIYNER